MAASLCGGDEDVLSAALGGSLAGDRFGTSCPFQGAGTNGGFPPHLAVHWPDVERRVFAAATAVGERTRIRRSWSIAAPHLVTPRQLPLQFTVRLTRSRFNVNRRPLSAGWSRSAVGRFVRHPVESLGPQVPVRRRGVRRSRSDPRPAVKNNGASLIEPVPGVCITRMRPDRVVIALATG
jgi:hypothetical protein